MQGADEINSVCFNLYLHVLSNQAELKWLRFQIIFAHIGSIALGNYTNLLNVCFELQKEQGEILDEKLTSILKSN